MVQGPLGCAKFNEQRNFRFGQEIAENYARSKSWLPALKLGRRDDRSSVQREGRQHGGQA